MKQKFRCNCPITTALDVIGDKWSLVIIKQMLFEGKFTFKDFSNSDEAIATNILSTRLSMLEEFSIIEKVKLPTNKKTNIYLLTEKGLALIPILLEMSIWSKYNVQDFHPDMNLTEDLLKVEKDKEAAFKIVKLGYEEFRKSILI